MSFQEQTGTTVQLKVPVAVMILAATAIPVELRPPMEGMLDLRWDTADIVLNILGYIPLGAMFVGSAAIPAILTAALVSLVAELSQFLAVSRFPGPVDVLCNMLGATIGMVSATLWPWFMPVLHIRKRTAIVSAVAAAAILGLQALPGKLSTLENWDLAAQLAVGDELTRNRPWQGQIRELAIVSGVFNSATMREITTGRRLIADVARTVVFGPARDLNLEELRGRPILIGTRLRRFHDEIINRGAFTVLAHLQTAESYQTGPARIVTYSRDPFSRNFTLGHEENSLVFRVRTPASGLNGSNPELHTLPVVTAQKSMLIAASYDGLISRVFVDGRMAGRLNVSAAGKLFLDLADIYLPVVPVGIGMLTAVAAIGLWRWNSYPIRLLTAAIAGLAAGVLFMLSGGASTVPLFESWTPLSGLAGGIAIAVGMKRSLSAA